MTTFISSQIQYLYYLNAMQEREGYVQYIYIHVFAYEVSRFQHWIVERCRVYKVWNQVVFSSGIWRTISLVQRGLKVERFTASRQQLKPKSKAHLHIRYESLNSLRTAREKKKYQVMYSTSLLSRIKMDMRRDLNKDIRSSILPPPCCHLPSHTTATTAISHLRTTVGAPRWVSPPSFSLVPATH